MGDKYEALEKTALELGAAEAKIMDTKDVVFDARSHLKCRFGCNRWGKYWTCPPNLSISQETFMEGFKKYHKAIIIKTADPKKGQDVALGIEKEAMLRHGCGFAFALALCVQCDECSYPDPCRFPHLARPSMDTYGMDIGMTLEPLGFKVEFDKDGKLLPAWYSMVLLD
jgi:predicted metal-binding protein